MDALAWVRSAHQSFAEKERALAESLDAERRAAEERAAQWRADQQARLAAEAELAQARTEIQSLQFRVQELEDADRQTRDSAAQAQKALEEKERALAERLDAERRVAEERAAKWRVDQHARLAAEAELAAARAECAQLRAALARAQADGAAAGDRAMRAQARTDELQAQAARLEGRRHATAQALAERLQEAAALRDALESLASQADMAGTAAVDCHRGAARLATGLKTMMQERPTTPDGPTGPATGMAEGAWPSSVAELLRLADSRFVLAAYQCLLGRPADPQGHANYVQKLREGEPKEGIIAALAESAEGQRAGARIEGLPEFLAHWSRRRPGRIARLLARALGDAPTASAARVRALENAFAASSDSLQQRLRDLEVSLARLESRTGLAIERLDLRQAASATPAPSGDAPSGGPRAPFVIELEYARTASPASLGESDDSRQLAVGFRAIELVDIASGEALCRVDLRRAGDGASAVLFGMGASEDWGTWSTGGLSALALWPPREPRGSLLLRIDGFIYDRAFSTLDVEVRSSLGHHGRATLASAAPGAEVVLEAPGPSARPMFFGARATVPDPLNVSRSVALPKVSVVILNYNKPVLSALSAMAVEASRPRVPYEILVVDNGSTADNVELLERMDSVGRTVRLPVNRFFGEGNNLGAEQARGEYLLFLNNDAFLAEGCIDELLAAFDEQADCGAVCPVFVYPDGRIQEAGGFVRPDATALQRGKHDAAFRREALPRFEAVDYGSAACLLLRKSTFERLGGFNYRYDPAYYEDTDLCLRLQLIGLRCVLARDAECAHIENATTSDRKHNAGANKVLELNRATFASTWGRFLATRAPQDLPAGVLPAAPAPALAAAARQCTQATYSPYPLVPGGGERYLLATALALESFGPTAFATPDPYSRLRLHNVLSDLALPSGRIVPRSMDDVAQGGLERLVLMGNEALPRFRPPARRAFFHCQFPFPWREASEEELASALAALDGFEKVIVNSEFTRRAYRAALGAYGRQAQVEVVYPPVAAERLVGGGQAVRKPQVLSIGRFTDQGHHKRQDVLIEAMKAAPAEFRRGWRLVLCGSVPNDPAAKAYFERLRASAGEDIEVEFVISPSREVLDRLLLESAVYAHATGFGVQHEDEHWRCEHFGITIVEAIAAGCTTFCYGTGGGPEILRHTGGGQTFVTVEELAHRMAGAGTEALPAEVRMRAVEHFGDAVFLKRMKEVLQ